MSIAENVTVGLRLNGVRGRDVLAERMERAVTDGCLVGRSKGPPARAPPPAFPAVEQQRLCIARAIVVQPEVILMDEPASALDPIATAKVEELILDLKHSFTIIIVTHNMQQAARISDFTAFFYLGELVEFDRTSKMFTNPSRKQTEDYVTGRFG